jgi:hypothetical protein
MRIPLVDAVHFAFFLRDLTRIQLHESIHRE